MKSINFGYGRLVIALFTKLLLSFGAAPAALAPWERYELDAPSRWRGLCAGGH